MDTSNQASQASSVAVTRAAVQRAGWCRTVSSPVSAKLTISSESKPTQVRLQCVVTYRSGADPFLDQDRFAETFGELELTYYAALPPNVGLVAISDAQRNSAPSLRWIGTVLNAVDVDALEVGARRDEENPYLLLMARICRDKGQHVAIDAAKRAGLRLILAGKVENSEESQEYFKREVEPAMVEDHGFLPSRKGETHGTRQLRASRPEPCGQRTPTPGHPGVVVMHLMRFIPARLGFSRRSGTRFTRRPVPASPVSDPVDLITDRHHVDHRS